MIRRDLFLTVHKGLRAELFETARLVARADFAAAQSCTEVERRLHRSFAFLEEHAAHEDEAIFPALQALAPVLCAELQSDHSRVDGRMLEITRLAQRLAESAPLERVALGRRLHAAMGSFLAEYLRHMEREEAEVNRMLWAHASDAELGQIEGRILGSIAPARLADWLEIMLPAASAAECAEILGGLASAVPAHVFQELTGPARRVLGESEWSTILARVAATTPDTGVQA